MSSLRERLPDIIEMRDRGVSDRQIAWRLGFSPEYIRRVAGNNGRCGTPRDPGFVAAARKLWLQRKPRLSVRDIALHLGVSKNVIIGVAHRNAFPARPSPIRRSP